MTHILVLGAGSVGKRHLENFRSLGCEVSAMDPRADRLAEASARGALVGLYPDLTSALADPTRYHGVVVASPPSFHVDQSIAAIDAGLPVFLEKPVAPDLKDAQRLAQAVERTRVPLLLGYTYRWWPPLHDLRRLLAEGTIGQVRRVEFVMSAHLADWHPWEPYQEFFMASRELGGGALLDESHFLDLMLWLFGMPQETMARVERISDLKIDTDDNVDAIFRYRDGPRVSVHLDLYGRPHRKHIIVVGERGTIEWSFDPNRLRTSVNGSPSWTEQTYPHERNAMFLDAAKEFLAVISGGASPRCTIRDGVEVLRVVEAMRQSSSTGRSVTIERL